MKRMKVRTIFSTRLGAISAGAVRIVGTNRAHIVVLVLLVASICVMYAAALGGRFTSNVGLLTLSRVLAQHNVLGDEGRDDLALAHAEQWLNLATQLDATNASAWRGLGFALATQGQQDEAIAAWKKTNTMWNEAMRWGDIALKEEQARQALQWYQRATALEPQIGDGWYSQGLAYEALEQWDEALYAYQQATAAKTFIKRGPSSSYYRIGIILQWHRNRPQLPEAEAAFQTALALHAFGAETEAADAHYRLGEIYRLQGLNPKDFLPEFQQAVNLDPRHYWAHLRLGDTLYRLHKNVDEAEREISLALSLWPNATNRKWPYRSLGEIYLEAGLKDKAAAAFTEVLRLDPADDRASAVLSTLAGANMSLPQVK